ncbi:MAG: TIGR03032 family protein [Alphaproteobacteria bacterium]|nr:TIGR03032 family protein [Alphaproteobacteria bacterium]
MSVSITSAGDSAPPYSFSASPGLAAWLHQENVALALTTYQIGKLFLVGAPTPERLVVTERTFERCLGVAVSGSALVLAGLNNIIRFDNVVPPGQSLEGHDAVYVPQVAWYTGDVFAHDVGILRSGRPVFINTLFGCLATVDEETSFRPVWMPPFLTALRPEDRCHLNGLAMEDGRPRFVTAAAMSDTAGGWRELRTGGGCVMDVASSAIVATGLSMPHSPRLADGRLFLCNAGTGELGEVDLASGIFIPIAFCAGFARGLALHRGHAVVGLSLPRQHKDFSGLPLDDRLKAAGRNPECVVQVIDLARGTAVHWLQIGGVVRELYDIALIPNQRSPMAVGFAQGQINRLISRGAPITLDDLERH